MQVCFQNLLMDISFYLKTNITLGELSSRLVEDLETIRDGIGFRVGDFLCLFSRIIGTLVFSFYTGWKLTLVFLSISPLIILCFNLLIKVRRIKCSSSEG